MISFQYNRFSELYYITLQNKLGAGKGTVREHITVKIIISIPYFGLICKLLDKKQPRPKVRLNIRKNVENLLHRSLDKCVKICYTYYGSSAEKRKLGGKFMRKLLSLLLGVFMLCALLAGCDAPNESYQITTSMYQELLNVYKELLISEINGEDVSALEPSQFTSISPEVLKALKNVTANSANYSMGYSVKDKPGGYELVKD